MDHLWTPWRFAYVTAADAAVRAAGSPEPVLLEMNLPQLMALLRRAKVFVAGDTGPLHLADALGTISP